MQVVVADTACLIGLSRIGRLEILLDLFHEVLIPPRVAHEFGENISWLKVQSPTDLALVARANALMDAGEAEAVALSIEQHVPVILDDNTARKRAEELGASVMGTVGVLLRAKKAGRIQAVKPLLEQLQQVGFYLSKDLFLHALILAGEANK